MKAKYSIELIFLFLLSIANPGFSQYPDAGEILKRTDQNLSSENRSFESEMIIHGRRGSRSIISKTWGIGSDKAFTEYLSPPREQGTKMLKLEDALWIYSPSTDRVIQIAGHMLRQSVMGSDMSYEDLMENTRLEESYTATVSSEEAVDGRPCYVLNLVAKEDVAYYKRIQWIDKENYVPLKEELYARSGKLLKTTQLTDVRWVDGRWFPHKILFRDALKAGDGTEFIIRNITFNSEMDESRFSKAALRQ